MFDIGSWEFLLVIVVGLLVIGPKELPATIRTVRGYVRRMRELAGEFRAGIDEVVREAELSEVKEDIKSAVDTSELADIGRSIRDEITEDLDPTGGDMGFDDLADVLRPDEHDPDKRALKEDPQPAPAEPDDAEPAAPAEPDAEKPDGERAKAGR